jgi:hypothetical protein
MEFNKPISLSPFMPEFMSGTDGAARSAAKKLTSAIYSSLVQNTINAPDWYVPPSRISILGIDPVNKGYLIRCSNGPRHALA